MNKDVIYIEPEQDITDILSSVKASKHKIVALVPPKKAGVLRSSVNFKLIAKAAAKNDKTVVLVTTDESLRRLASSVSIPVAKNLQSKPQVLDETEIEADKDAEPAEEAEEEKPVEKEAEEEKPAEEEKEEKEKQSAKKIAVAAPIKEKKVESAEDDVIEGEPEPDNGDKDTPKTKKEKALVKMKGTKIPNFAKYRKFIVAGIIALIIIVGFSIWANVVAPAATITIKVKTTAANFTEKVQFVNDESKADAKAGIFFITEKTVTKTAEGEFKATGQVDKGTKASGTITIIRPAGDIIKTDGSNMKFVIPNGTKFTIDGKEYSITSDIDLSASDDHRKFCGYSQCTSEEIKKTATIVAKENGEGYNIEAKTSGIKSSVTIPSNYKVSTTAISGGAIKMVTVVSKNDIETATSDLGNDGDDEARGELEAEFGNNYVFLGSMKKGESKVTTTPALDEEVGEGVTPKITREITYTMYAVEHEPVKQYIEATVLASLGDDTQIVYDTGVSTDKEKNKAFFESFQNSSEENTAKLKSITKTGPRVTDEMVREKSLGKKVGEVQSILKSINGVSSVKVNTSYFWVNSVPNDTNKVEINIENED